MCAAGERRQRATQAPGSRNPGKAVASNRRPDRSERRRRPERAMNRIAWMAGATLRALGSTCITEKAPGDTDWKSVNSVCRSSGPSAILGAVGPGFHASVTPLADGAGATRATVRGGRIVRLQTMLGACLSTPARQFRRPQPKQSARLGGSANMLKPFPAKPKRMHWRTYYVPRSRRRRAWYCRAHLPRGRRAPLHTLRHSFATRAARRCRTDAAVPPRIAHPH